MKQSLYRHVRRAAEPHKRAQGRARYYQIVRRFPTHPKNGKVMDAYDCGYAGWLAWASKA